MKRKDIKILLLAVVTSIAMAGCGTDDESNAASKDSNKVAELIGEESEGGNGLGEADGEADNEDKTSLNKESENTGEVGTAVGTAGDNEISSNGDESTSGSENGTSAGSSGTSGTNAVGNGTGGSGSASGGSTGGSGSTSGSSTGSSSSAGGSGNTGATGESSAGGGSNTGGSNNSTGSNVNNGSSGQKPSNSSEGTTKQEVKVEAETTAAISVGNANTQISEQNKDIVNNNKTEYTATSNNSNTKKIYVSEDSINYGYALAYVNGDTSRLDDTEKQIFAVVKPIIDNVMANFGTDHEREKAIHDYIVSNCRYNIEACENLMTMEDYNFHPEGVFLKKKAVCQGYAESFKLCMDLLGIRCDIVTGTGVSSDGSGMAHAWNAVCLDNEWYQVDCTWDDPLINVNGQQQDSGTIYYNYFNITDARMKTDHVYTYENACNGTKYSYDYFAEKECGTIYSTVADYSTYVNSQLSAGVTDITVYVRCEGSVTIQNYLNDNQINLRNFPTNRGLSMSLEAGSVSDTIYKIKIKVTVN